MQTTAEGLHSAIEDVMCRRPDLIERMRIISSCLGVAFDEQLLFTCVQRLHAEADLDSLTDSRQRRFPLGEDPRLTGQPYTTDGGLAGLVERALDRFTMHILGTLHKSSQ